MTFVFNVFVFLQIFNFLNSRKIDDEVNVFEGLSRSGWFIVINILIIVLQFLIVQFGDRAMACSWGGLNMMQWIYCLIIGCTGLFISILTKVVYKQKSEHEEMAENEGEASGNGQGMHGSQVAPA